MADRENSRQPPWTPENADERLSFGTWLRRQREIREIPLREIADVTKISMRYLEALEQDRFDVLPAAVFAKGFLREYSRYVGLDPDEVVNSFLQAQEGHAAEEDDVKAEAVQRSRRQWTSGLLLVLGLLAVIGVVAALIAFGGGDRTRSSEPPPPIAVPATVEPRPAPAEEPKEQPAEEAVRSAPLVVTLDFTEDCWVEASIDGEPRISELHVQGESVTYEAEERVLLTLGNPQGVRVEVNGEVYDPGFRPGRVARDLEIDLAAIGVSAEPRVPQVE